MSIEKQLDGFAAWLGRESRCPPEEAGEQPPNSGADSSADPAHPRPLSSYLALAAPGGLDAENPPLDAARAPLLLSMTRYRRVPVNWWAVLEGSEAAKDWAADALRGRIEARWLLEAGAAARIPTAAVETTLNRAQHCIRLFVPGKLGSGAFFIEVDVPADALIVRENPRTHAAPRYYALISYSGQILAGGSPWVLVREVVEIFPKGEAAKPWAKDVARTLAGVLQGSSAEWPIEPVAMPVLSSRMSARTFAGRMAHEWRLELVTAELGKYVVKTTAAPAEKYWSRDEKERADIFEKSKKTLVELLANKSTFEHDILKDVPAGCWVIMEGDRRYLVQFRDEVPAADIAKLDLTDPVQYEAAWQKQIKGLQPLAWAAPGSAKAPAWYPFGYLHPVDLSPNLILEQFARFKAEREVAEASEKLGQAILDKAGELVDREPEDIAARFEHALDLKSRTFNARWKILTLKQRAAKLGYVLATGFEFNGLKDNEVMVPVGPGKTDKKQVEIGNLYRSEERTATYSVTQTEYSTSVGIGLRDPFSIGLPIGGFDIPGLSVPGINLGGVFGGLGIFGSGGVSIPLPIPGLPDGGLPVPGLPGLGIGPRRTRREYQVQESVRYLDLVQVDVDAEPWEALRQGLAQLGFDCLLADIGPDGYVVEGGIPLRQILGRCLLDEGYRQRLAVFLPVYERQFDQEQKKVRYVVAIRPEPGMDATGFPSIYCAEELSYRAEWRGTELGELLHTVSLAPGEEREVTITRTVEQKTERVDSITSILDVTKSDRLDLQTSLQETLRKEQSSKNTFNWNANASASVGWFSGGAGAGGSQESTASEFAETVKKSAMQATREMRVNQRQEIKSSTNTSTSVRSEESTRTKFTNINQGRTLNIQFHEVNNIYSAGLVLEGLSLTYVPAVELVQGTGVHDRINFRLTELAGLLTCANNDGALTGGDYLFDVPSLERRILRTVVKTILEEYVALETGSDQPAPDEPPDGDGLGLMGDLISVFERSAAVLGVSPSAVDLLGEVVDIVNHSLEAARTKQGGSGMEEDPAEECAKYVELLKQIYDRGQVLEPHTLTTPSGSTYADARVGLIPSTEPYSERMRETEVELKYADIENRYAEAASRRVLAGLPEGTGELRVVEAELDRTAGGGLRVVVTPELPAGRWDLICDAERIASARIRRPSARLEIWPEARAEWPRDGGHRWLLLSADGKRCLSLPIY